MVDEIKITKGDGTALGIMASAVAFFLFSLYNIGVFPYLTQSMVMIAPALMFGGVVMLLAAHWQYNNGDTFGATSFGVFSAFFLIYGLAETGLILGWFGPLGIVAVIHLIGLVAIAFAIITLIFWIASFRIFLALNLMYLLLLITWILVAIPLTTFTLSLTTGAMSTAFGSFPGAMQAAGYVGFIVSLILFWIGAAAVINNIWVITGKKAPIPLFPLVKAKK